jgi:hypothetical protein
LPEEELEEDPEVFLEVEEQVVTELPQNLQYLEA